MTQTEWIISLDDDLKDHEELFVGNVRDGNRLTRCKDCKRNKSDKWVDCPITEMFGRTTDNYCSLAERKE